MVVRAGGTLYTDIYDRKPPLPPLLYAASFSLTDSTDIRLMRVLVTVMLAAAGILVALECLRRWGPRHAWWGGVLLIAGAMALFPADAGAANYAHFALLPGTAAIIWARRGTLLMALAAGVAIGIAILCRQSWLLGVVPACVSIGLHGRWRNVPPFVAAAAATVATTGFYAPLGRFWEWNVTDSPGFVFAGTSVWSALGSGLASIAGFAAFHPVVTVAIGVAIAAAAEAIRRRAVPGDIDLWLWVSLGHRRLGGRTAILRPLLVAGPATASCCWRFPSSPAGRGRARTAAIVGVAVPAVGRRGCCCSSRVRSTTGPTPTFWPATSRSHTTDCRSRVRVGLVPRGAGCRGSAAGRRLGAHRLRRRPLGRPQRPGEDAARAPSRAHSTS